MSFIIEVYLTVTKAKTMIIAFPVYIHFLWLQTI